MRPCFFHALPPPFNAIEMPHPMKPARNFNHFEHQYAHDKHVGTHGSCVRSVGIESK